MLNYINLVRKLAKAVQNRNEENPDVKTADSSVFENISKKLDREEVEIGNNVDRREMFDRMRRRMEEVKHENEEDPQIETADKSVFEDLLKEIDILKHKVEAQDHNQSADQQSDTQWDEPSMHSINRESQAVTNSNGGSLALTRDPQIGGAAHQIRVPHASLVKVLKYSENIINLDNKNSRFAYIDYNGQQGWIPEIYLNFN